MGVPISERDGAVRFAVHVQPGASKTEIAGLRGDALRIRLTARPIEGAANATLVEFLSERFVVPRRSVRIVAGAQSRAKVVEIDGITVEAARRILTLAGE